MTTYFWGAPPGAPGDFDDVNDWFNTEKQQFGIGVPGIADTANVVGAIPDALHPIPVQLDIAPGQTATISTLQVLFQSHDEDFVWIQGNLTVVDEILFENDRGNLRFFKGTVTLDGFVPDPGEPSEAGLGGTTDGARMDVDYLHIGHISGPPVTSARNVVSVDNDGMLRVVNNAQVTSRHLEVLGTGGFAVAGGGAVDVAGPVEIEQSEGALPVSVDGQSSRLVIHGTSGYGLDISGLGSLSITNGGTIDVTGKTVLHSGGAPVLVDGPFSNLMVKGSYGLEISGLGSLKITNGGTADVTGKMVIHQDTTASAVSVEGPGSALLVGDGLSLDGYLSVVRGASGRADDVTINSTNIASLVVGDLTGQNVFSLFTANTVTLGDGEGGAGLLWALPNGQVRVKESLTLLNPITDASTFSGALGTIGDGWIEIGPRIPPSEDHQGTPIPQPDTIQVNPDGELIGHGMVDTGTFRNDGNVGAQDGLLFIDADVTGEGIFGVATHSTLEIGANVDPTVTIALGGTFSTLILDVHDKFDGKIASIDLTDTIRLRHDFGETVEWAAILPGSAGAELWVLQDNRFLEYDVDGTESLLGKTVVVTPSADKMSTALSIAPHGLVTTHYLDAQGRRTVTFKSGDDQGGKTEVFAQRDGTLTSAESGEAPNRVYYDYRDQELKEYRADWIAENGEKAFSYVTYDNSKLAPLKIGFDVQLPSAPDVSQPHNFWYSLRHGPMKTLEADDGLGHAGTLASAGHYVRATFENGMVRFIVDSLPVTMSALPAMASSFGMSGEISTGPQGLPGFGSNNWRLSKVEFAPVTRVLTAFTTTEYVDGAPDIVTEWTKHADDAGWDYVETFVNASFSKQESATALFMHNEILPRLGELSPPGSPLVLPNHTVELAPLVTGPRGTNVAPGQPNLGNALIDPSGAVRSQEAAGVVAPDGAGVVSPDGAGFGQLELAKLVGQNGADMKAKLVGQNGADIVAGGGLNLIASSGSNIVAGGGLNSGGLKFGPEEATKVVQAGFGNVFTLAGAGTPGRYAAGALVFADSNDDRELNNGEAWTFTDTSGRFQLFGGWGTLVLMGGTDTGTGLPLTATLTAPLGSTDISALSTLASGLAADDGDIDGAIAQLQKAMALDASVDFTVIDPIASTENGDAASARIHVEMSKTMDAVLLIGAAFAGMGADQSKAQDAAFAAMVGAVNKNNALNLTDKGTVAALIADVGTALSIDGSKIADALAGTIVSTGQLIDKLLVDQGAGTGLTSGITMVEAGVQGGLVSSFKAAAGDPNKLGPAIIQLQASTVDANSVVTPTEVVTITVTTSEAVTVTGAPTLQLSNGKAASFVGGSGGSSLVFKYEAQAGDGAGALAVGGLALDAGGSIKDGSGNVLSGSVSGGLGLALDTGALVSVAFAEAVKAEGSGGGTAPFTVILTRIGDTSVAHSIAWSLAGPGLFGADPEDFAGGSLPNGGVVTFTAGETSRTIIVEVAADSEVETDETFQIDLSAPSLGLAIGEGLAIGTIRNDDARVSIAAQSTGQAEGNSGQATFTFSLTREGDLSATQSFAYAVSGSGAVAATASDFVGQGLPAGRVTFVPNQAAAAITIAVSGDTTVEADEGFTVTLSDPSPGLVLGTASAAVMIQNDDGAVVSIETLSAQKAEQDSGATPFTFIVRLGEESAVPQSVDWSVTGTGEHPADGADFEGGVLPSGTVSFAPGETGKLVTLPVSGDRAVEFDDFFVVTLSNPSNGLSLATASANGIVQNDDRATVSIAALSAGKPEGDAGTTPFTFTLSLDQASVFDQGVGWTVTGSGGQAADAADFGGALPAGTVSFAPGETSKTITVAVSGDILVEPDEEFTVALVDLSTGLVPGTASAVGTIEGDDSVTVSLAAASAVKPEGNGGSTAYTFTVSLSQAGTTGMTVAWAAGGSGQTPATAADFGGTLPSGTVSFAAGETSRTITVSVSGDTVVELDEEFTVNLSNPSAGSLAGGAATGTIQNDDRSAVSIAAQSAVKAEGNGGTTASTFVISLSQAGVTTQTVGWSVAGAGTNAASAADFAGGALPGGIVTFAPGETSKVVTVSVAGDTAVEPDEGYGVTLWGLSAGLVAGVASAAGTIQNDDVAVAVTAHNDAYVVLRGQPLTATAGVLSNDVAATTATLLSGPAHGTLQLAGNGTFTYAAAAGFSGIDSFTYRAGNGGSTDDGQVHVHVVPVNAGTSTTLDLLTLTAEEQIAATYVAFFGRGADEGGHGFWVDQFNANRATQSPAALFANIASSFGISDEARALYPFLVSPFTATDGQISAFLDSVYNNLFNRSSDAGGLGYWTDQIKQTLQAGQFVGSILVNIMSGAQDTAVGKDITTLMGKVAVSLAFVREQEEHHTVWAGASDTAAATTLLQAVTADPQSVLVGVRNAEIVIAAHA